jgi:hypothetical protein
MLYERRAYFFAWFFLFSYKHCGGFIMMRKTFFAATIFLLVPFCTPSGCFAEHAQPALKAPFFQSIIKAAGIHSVIISSDTDTGYPSSVYLPYLKGSSVTIGLPPDGLRRGAPFLLEIDGMLATVICTDDGKLKILDGDRRMAATGIFSTLECLFSAVLTMLANLFDAILSLDILGILESIVGGILSIINCIIY